MPSASATGARLAPVAFGLLLWAVALPSIDVRDLGQYGLLPELPVTWYAALAGLVIGGLVVTWSSERPSGWVLAAYVGAVVLVLHGTVAAVADVPQFPWVYKHVGVTELIQTSGGIDPSVDIYNRWPGLFAAAAAFSDIAGLPDPVTWVAWAEPLFMAVNALLVGAIATVVTRDVRVAATAALLFVCVNWVGQTYYSPQAVASTLGLTVVLVAVHVLGRRGGRPAGWTLAGAVAVLGLLDCAIVVTHQLTPWVVLAQLGGLALAGLIRPAWIVLGMAGLSAAFLLVNVSYVADHFALVTGFDPLDNLRSAGTYDEALSDGKVLNARAGQLLAVAMWSGALLAAWRLRRTAHRQRVLALAILSFAPFLVAVGQSYGGEAVLRMILFSAPGCAILMAAALATLPGRFLRLGLACGAGAAFAACAWWRRSA